MITAETLEGLENNTTLKTRYAGAGSLGRNKLIALPIIVGFFSLFAIYFLYDMSATEPGYSMPLYVCVGIVLGCIVTVVLMQRTAKVQTLGNLDDVKSAVARTTTGNDTSKVYYCIYTTGSKRHNAEFINSIAYKIDHISEEPDQQLRGKIARMFGPKLASPGGAAVLLPETFTNGEKVYQKQFNLSILDQDTKTAIQDNGGLFPVLVYHNANAQFIKQRDLAEL